MIEFFVEGKPVSKQRPRFANKNGKVIVYTPSKTKAYEMAIGLKARLACTAAKLKSPLTVPVCVQIDCWTESRADIDNIAKSVLDGMNGIVYEDDKQVVELHCKRIAPPWPTEKTIITVTKYA